MVAVLVSQDDLVAWSRSGLPFACSHAREHVSHTHGLTGDDFLEVADWTDYASPLLQDVVVAALCLGHLPPAAPLSRRASPASSPPERCQSEYICSVKNSGFAGINSLLSVPYGVYF
jgi:hypothetical protein